MGVALRQFRSGKHIRRKRNILLQRFLIVVSICAVLVLVGALLSRIGALSLTQVEMRGAKTIAPTTIKATAMSFLRGNYLFLFRKTNLLLYPRSRIEFSILETFPAVRYATLSLEGRHTLVVDVEERTPQYLWCGTSREDFEADRGKCFFVDLEGYIYSEAPEFTQGVYRKLYGGDAVSPREFFLDSEGFKSFETILEGFSGIRVDVDRIFVGDIMPGGRETEGFAGPTIIKWNLQDPASAISTLGAILNDPSQGISLDAGTIEYIDVRFPNKAFYKSLSPI